MVIASTPALPLSQGSAPVMVGSTRGDENQQPRVLHAGRVCLVWGLGHVTSAQRSCWRLGSVRSMLSSLTAIAAINTKQ